ncbi:MAG: HAD-IIIA family hydrolase [Hyphomicrobiales bacterium]|nr:HAD-IIIA family hydrolase [Hyphomicrobiales bacterium]MCP5371616.1 HAD-IIIA family hydrolase [Hyphomicrobiales bacterium]
MATPLPLPDGAHIDDEGVWNQVLRPRPGGAPVPALFLDRDGVVVEEVNFLCRAEDVRLMPGAVAAIRRAHALGLAVVLVTNQAGIGYGYYTWHEFIAVQERVLADLAAAGAAVDAVYACPHHAKGQPPYHHPDHPARKPNPGMLLRAAAQLNLHLAESWIVGDRASDLAAGRNAGLAGGLHVATGHGAADGEAAAALALAGGGFTALAAAGMADALDLLPLLKGPPR